MTTIAVDLRNGKMASDSRVTCGDATWETDKIFECPDGSLVGICGALGDALAFVEWLSSGADKASKPTYSDSYFKALVLNAAGLSVWTADCVKMTMKNREFYAVGSGGLAAMGAMHAGADLAHAVKIAMLCDECSGGAVVVKEYVAKEAKKPVKRARKPRAAAVAKEQPPERLLSRQGQKAGSTRA